MKLPRGMLGAPGCPGALSIREPVPEFFPCPKCGNKEVEIWSDELNADCDMCRTTVYRPAEISCIDWCQYARECVGDEKFRELRGGESRPTK